MEYTMRDLRPGESGTVVGRISDPQLEKRMREFGLTEHTVVECVGCSPLGDPAAYRIRGVILALRNGDAAHVPLRR